jgi:hypothetical protein
MHGMHTVCKLLNMFDLIFHAQKYGAATLRWILQQLHSKTVLAHIGAFPNKCTIKHPFMNENSENL